MRTLWNCLTPYIFSSFLIRIETLILHITFTPPYKSHLSNSTHTTLFSLFRISVLLWRERRRSIDHVIQDASQTPHIDLISTGFSCHHGKWRDGTSVDFCLFLLECLSVNKMPRSWLNCICQKIGNLILHTETPVSTLDRLCLLLTSKFGHAWPAKTNASFWFILPSIQKSRLISSAKPKFTNFGSNSQKVNVRQSKREKVASNKLPL